MRQLKRLTVVGTDQALVDQLGLGVGADVLVPDGAVPFDAADQILDTVTVPVDDQGRCAKADIERLAVGGEHQLRVREAGVLLRTPIWIPDDAASLAPDDNVGQAVAVPVSQFHAAEQHAVRARAGFFYAFAAVADKARAWQSVGLPVRREQVKVDRVVRSRTATLRVRPRKIASVPFAEGLVKVAPVALGEELLFAGVRVDVADNFG